MVDRARMNSYPESGVPAPDAAPPVPSKTLATATDGLGDGPDEPKRVIIIGAGIAGLAAAFELARAGHQPIVLEAQNRVGGRIYTMRDFAPGLYAEAGAMRIPRVHELTHRYCELFNLKLRPFIMGNPRALLHLGGKAITMAEADENPDQLGFDLEEHERGKTCDQLWAEATADIQAAYDAEGPQGWERILAEYDHMSLRQFLENSGFSDAAIELYGLMSFREQNMGSAVVEQFFEIVGKSFEDMQEIEGGTDQLTDAFFRKVSRHVRMGAEVVAIDQDDEVVSVHYKTHAGRFTVHGDYAICTLPFPVLSNVEINPGLSREKRRAIRELRYNASTKILLQVRHRFWEHPKYDIVGGTTGTDLPIRRIVYPSYSDPSSPRGVLLASYTWGQDALRWGSMDEETRIEQAIEDVAKIHPEIVDEFELGASWAWFNDRYSGGAFAQFEPGQLTRLYPHIVAPEGRIHFAGEHCSLYHAWIQGALESALRAAGEIHRAPVAASARAGRSG